MKQLIKKLIPNFSLERFRRLRRRIQHEKVFTEIYKENKWGSSEEEFCSGAGSIDKRTVSAYVSMISKQASIEKFSDSNVF